MKYSKLIIYDIVNYKERKTDFLNGGLIITFLKEKRNTFIIIVNFKIPVYGIHISCNF